MPEHGLSRRHLLAALPSAVAAPPVRRPNIIFAFSDDHHYQCLGAAGNPHIQTPRLDQFASRGVLFTNGIISTPQCAPSRGVVLSGLEIHQNGLLSNGQTEFRPGLGPTAVDQLRRSGYETILVGKWHIKPSPAQCGFTRAPLWLAGGGSVYTNPRLRRGLEGKDEPVEGHITDLFTDAAIAAIERPERPFLLWLAYNAPHTPWHAGERWRSLYAGSSSGSLAPPGHPPGGAPFDWATYYAVISHLDDAFGRLVDHVDRSGLWHNTVVFFVGDNGYTCGTRGWTGKVWPWEESIRVPFLAAGGPVRQGVRLDDPVASIDLPATWLDYAGVPPAYRLAGDSLRGLLSSGGGRREAAFACWDDGRTSALAVKRAVEPYRLIRTRRHKLVVWESGRKELFDLEKDPAELNDLSGREPRGGRVGASLGERLRARLRSTGDRAAAWFG